MFFLGQNSSYTVLKRRTFVSSDCRIRLCFEQRAAWNSWCAWRLCQWCRQLRTLQTYICRPCSMTSISLLDKRGSNRTDQYVHWGRIQPIYLQKSGVTTSLCHHESHCCCTPFWTRRESRGSWKNRYCWTFGISTVLRDITLFWNSAWDINILMLGTVVQTVTVVGQGRVVVCANRLNDSYRMFRRTAIYGSSCRSNDDCSCFRSWKTWPTQCHISNKVHSIMHFRGCCGRSCHVDDDGYNGLLRATRR